MPNQALQNTVSQLAQNASADPAEEILRAAPLDDNARASLWDHYHVSAHPKDLQDRLSEFGELPPEVAAKLLDAKRQSQIPVPDPVTAALGKLGAISKKLLDLGESHPNIFQALLDSEKSSRQPHPQTANLSRGNASPVVPETETEPPNSDETESAGE